MRAIWTILSKIWLCCIKKSNSRQTYSDWITVKNSIFIWLKVWNYCESNDDSCNKAIKYNIFLDIFYQQNISYIVENIRYFRQYFMVVESWASDKKQKKILIYKRSSSKDLESQERIIPSENFKIRDRFFNDWNLVPKLICFEKRFAK